MLAKMIMLAHPPLSIILSTTKPSVRVILVLSFTACHLVNVCLSNIHFAIMQYNAIEPI